MKVEKFHPEINKVYLIESHTLIHILSGNGSIQVDFKNYLDWEEKAIFLEKGQYIKYSSDQFTVRKIEFSNEDKFYNSEIRVLFKHIISLGYIDLMECDACKNFLSESLINNSSADIIDISSKQWYWQNPFKANKEEYQIIFDTKEIIDTEYSNHLNSYDLVSYINERGYNAQAVIKDKIGISLKNLLSQRRLKEGQKELAFTDKNVQEIAFQLGFKDGNYFNRVFKNATGQTPKEFRNNFGYTNRDLFAQDIIALLQQHHMQERSLGFYADKMNLSIKTLSKKVQSKMNITFGKLVRLELVNTAKAMLTDGHSIANISINLGFEEPNHFSRFFKHYAGITPSDFKTKKCNS